MRIGISVVLVLMYVLFRVAFAPFQTAVQASVAVGQLADDKVQYALSQQAAQGAMGGWAMAVLIVTLLLLWAPAIIRKAKSLLTVAPVVTLMVAAMSLTACLEPREQVDVIGPNETAFLIPLEGSPKADQGKFMSEQFLEAAKVATKRITIPLRKLDRSNDWVPTIQIIKVDRTPIVREWVRSPDKGTTKSDESISVESKESIDFSLGVNASASITEADAAKFLYYFAGKSLADVMDQNVRGFVQSSLFSEFGARSLEAGRGDKGAIFTKVQTDARAFFQTQGVTIAYIGGAEGLTYKDPKIQEAINQVFQANQDVLTAEQQKRAQVERNLLAVDKAKADAEVLRLRGEQLGAYPGITAQTAAEKWDGKLPQYTGGPVPFLNVAGR